MFTFRMGRNLKKEKENRGKYCSNSLARLFLVSANKQKSENKQDEGHVTQTIKEKTTLRSRVWSCPQENLIEMSKTKPQKFINISESWHALKWLEDTHHSRAKKAIIASAWTQEVHVSMHHHISSITYLNIITPKNQWLKRFHGTTNFLLLKDNQVSSWCW